MVHIKLGWLLSVYIISPLFTLNSNCCFITQTVILQPSPEILCHTRKHTVGSSTAALQGKVSRECSDGGRQGQCPPHWQGTTPQCLAGWAEQGPWWSPGSSTHHWLPDTQVCGDPRSKVKPGSQLSTSGSVSRSVRCVARHSHTHNVAQTGTTANALPPHSWLHFQITFEYVETHGPEKNLQVVCGAFSLLFKIFIYARGIYKCSLNIVKPYSICSFVSKIGDCQVTSAEMSADSCMVIHVPPGSHKPELCAWKFMLPNSTEQQSLLA